MEKHSLLWLVPVKLILVSTVVSGYSGELAMDIYLTFDAKDKAVSFLIMYGKVIRAEEQMCSC